MLDFLEEDLSEILSLYQEKKVIERHVRLFKFVDLLPTSTDYQYSELSKNFVGKLMSSLIFEFLTNPHTYLNMNDCEFQNLTAATEFGERIDIESVIKTLTTKSDDRFPSLGFSLWRLGNLPQFHSLLEILLSSIYESNYQVVLQYINLDPKGMPKSYIDIDLAHEMKLLNLYAPLNCYRLLLYISPTIKVWLQAWESFKLSKFRNRSGIQNIFKTTAPYLNLNNDGYLNQFITILNEFDIQDKYIILGKLGEKSDAVVDMLSSEIFNSPDDHFWELNACLISAQVNSQALQIYIDRFEASNIHPLPIGEYALVNHYLSPLSQKSLKKLLELLDYPDPKVRGAAIDFLNHISDLDQDAYIYFNQLLAERNFEKKIIIVSLILDRPDLFREDPQALLNSLIDIAELPSSYIRKLESSYHLVIRNLRDLALRTVVRFALSQPGEQQIDLMMIVLTRLQHEDEEFLNNLEDLLIRDSKFFITSFFGAEYQSKVYAFLNQEHLKAENLPNILYENLLLGQAICLTEFLFEPALSMIPEIEAARLQLRHENYQKINSIREFASSAAQFLSLDVTMDMLRLSYSTLEQIDKSKLTSLEQNDTKYQSGFLTNNEYLQSEYVLRILEKIERPIPTGSSVEFLAYIKNHNKQLQLTENQFEDVKCLILKTKDLNDKKEILLSLPKFTFMDFKNKIIDFYLTFIASPRNHIEIATALISLQQIIRYNRIILSAYEKGEIIKIIKKYCLDNTKYIYATQLISAINVQEIAFSLIYDLSIAYSGSSRSVIPNHIGH